MRTVTKKELIERIAETAGVTKSAARDVIQGFLDAIMNELAAGNRLEFREFGVFEVRTRKPRSAQNPRTLEKVMVPARRSVRFKAGRIMKERLGIQDGGKRGKPTADHSDHSDRAGDA